MDSDAMPLRHKRGAGWWLSVDGGESWQWFHNLKIVERALRDAGRFVSETKLQHIHWARESAREGRTAKRRFAPLPLHVLFHSGTEHHLHVSPTD
jgi:hypothetical protein